jgi:hypothetical protein
LLLAAVSVQCARRAIFEDEGCNFIVATFPSQVMKIAGQVILFTMFARRVLCQVPRAVVAGASRAAGPAAALRKVRWHSHHYRVQPSSQLSVELCVCVCNRCGCGRPQVSCGPCRRQLGSGEGLQVPSVHRRVVPSAPSFRQPDLVLCTSCVARCICATRRVGWLQEGNVNHA